MLLMSSIMVMRGAVLAQGRLGLPPLNRYLPPLNYAPPFPPRPPGRGHPAAFHSPGRPQSAFHRQQQGASGSATSTGGAGSVSFGGRNAASAVTPIPILRQTYTNEGQGNYNFV